ncbi:MAG TPA: class I SAM-dependent methyltransferase [Thermodesulfobacteriota bacterium]|nr:class I SAM-dependent methyltransferase [Thermodesulfobacteriota bacterium]
MSEKEDWGRRAQRGFLASGIDPGDRRGHKNHYIDFLQKMALEEVLELKGDEMVLDFGCGSGRIAYWIAPKVRKVFGLEVTLEMIQLAEQNRTSENVEFVLYDGAHFPVLPSPVDRLLSLGVLQIMGKESLKRTVSQLTRYLKPDGRMILIEQASDNLKVDRPRVQDYLDAFSEARLACLRHYPIRRGRSGLLYLIRYGWIPKAWLRSIARRELRTMRDQKGTIGYYRDFLFLLEKRS